MSSLRSPARAGSLMGRSVSSSCSDIPQWRGLESLEPRTLLSAGLAYTPINLGDGLRGYTFYITCDDGQQASFAATIGFRGVNGATIQQIASGAFDINTEAMADIADGIDGYEKVKDTWTFAPFSDNTIPGNDPFGAGTFSGIVDEENLFMLSLGSGVGPELGDGVALAYVVADGEVEWAGSIARGAQLFETTGVAVPGSDIAVSIDALATNDTTPELTGTVDDAVAAVEVTVNGQTYAATNNGDGTWTLADNTIAALAEGTYDVSVTATNVGEGTEGTDNSANELVVDATAPTVTIDSRTTDDNTPQLTGTVSEASATVEVTVDGQTYEATNNGDGTWTLADNLVASLADGTYDVQVTATDAAGNVGNDATSDELTIDTTELTVTITPKSTGDRTPSLSGTVSQANATVMVIVDGRQYEATNNGDGTWALADDVVQQLPVGTYDVSVIADDGESVAHDETSDELTIQPYTIGLTYSVVNLGGGLRGYTFSITNNDGLLQSYAVTLGFRGLNGATIQNATLGASPDVNDEATADFLVGFGFDKTTDTYTLTPFDATGAIPGNSALFGDSFAGYRQGEDFFEFSVGTGAGSQYGDNTLLAYVVADGDVEWAGSIARGVGLYDTSGVAEGGDTITVTVDDLVTSDSTPQLTGTVSDAAATVEVTVNGETYEATNNGDGSWTLADDAIANLADGTYDVSVVATNAGEGTNGTDHSANELVVDTTAPTVTITSRTTSDATPRLAGLVNDITATIEVTVNGQTYTATNNGDGNWILADNVVAALADGTYDVQVTATDAAGNVGNDATSDELTIDTTELTVTITSKSTSDRTPGLSGTVSRSDASVTVIVDGEVYEATNNGDGTWTLADNVVAELSAGTYDVAVTADDGEDVASDETTDELTIQPYTIGLTYSVVNLGSGLRGYTFSITNNDGLLQSYAATLGFRGVNGATIQQIASGAFDIDTEAMADIADGIGDYEKAKDTWTFAPFSENAIPGNDPFGEGAFTGIVNDDNLFMLSLGSGSGSELGDGVAVVYVVADGDVEWAGSIARGVGLYDTSGVAESGDLITVTVDALATNDSTPQLTGTVSDAAATVEVTVDGQTYTATNNGDGTWTLADDAIAGLADGTYDIHVVATNAGEGTDGTDHSADELVVDATAPVVTITPRGLTNDSTPQLSGTIDDATATVTVTVNGQDYEATNNGDGTWTLADGAIAALADGTYDLSVTAVDSVGNEGTDTAVGGLTVDTTAPTVAVTPRLTTDNTPQLSGTVTDTTATVEVTVDGETYEATNNGDGTWTLADGTLPALADGTYDVTVTATDAAGNVGTDATTDELVVDATAPVVSVYIRRTNDSTPRLTGLVNDATATVEVTVNGQAYAATNNGDGTWTLADGTIDALAEGTYDVAVTATDAAGNVGSDATTDELTVDFSAPTLGVDSLVTFDTTPQLTGTVDDATATVTVTVNGQTYAATNNGDGTWTLADGTLPALAEGLHDVTVEAEDTFGNTANETAENALQVNIAPVVTLAGRITNQTSPQLTGTVDDATATVEVTVNGQTYEATNNGDGTWTLAAGTIVALGDGTYDVTVTAIDALGNEGSEEGLGALTIDTVAPTVTIAVQPTFDNTPQLTGTVNDVTAVVTVTIDGHIYTATNNGDGTWTLADGAISPLASTDHDVTVTATDAAGNETNDTDTLVVRTQIVLGGQTRQRAVTFTDANGTLVRIMIQGGTTGEVRLVFSGESELAVSGTFRRAVQGAEGAVLESVEIVSDTRGLSINTRGGDNAFTIQQITGDATLGRLMGRTVSLVGDGINMAGGVIENIALQDIRADITMGGEAARGVTIKASGDIDGANILVDSDIRSLMAGRIIDSSIFAGVAAPVDVNADGVYDLPAANLGNRTIGRVNVRGNRGVDGDSFTNANIAAANIGTVSLKDVTLNNGGEAFGIAASQLRGVRLRQGRSGYSFPRRWMQDAEDFTVRIV